MPKRKRKFREEKDPFDDSDEENLEASQQDSTDSAIELTLASGEPKSKKVALTELSRGLNLPTLAKHPRLDECRARCAQLETRLTGPRLESLKELMARENSFNPKPSGRAANADADSKEKEFRIRGKCLMETHNGDFSVATLEKDFADFVQYCRQFNAWRVTVKAERSIHGKDKNGNPTSDKVHFHCVLELDRSDKEFNFLPQGEHDHRFRGVVPYFSPTKPRGRRFDQVAKRAHFYAFCSKVGWLRRLSWQRGRGAHGTLLEPYAAFAQYGVQASWADDLWSIGKLSHDDYEFYIEKIKVGFEQRKRNSQAPQPPPF